jgi:hypothetical protein
MDEYLGAAEFLDQLGNLRFRALSENNFCGGVILEIKHTVTLLSMIVIFNHMRVMLACNNRLFYIALTTKRCALNIAMGLFRINFVVRLITRSDGF